MSNRLGTYSIEEYQVTLPDGQVITKRQIVYYDKQGGEVSREQYTEQKISEDYMDTTDPTEVVNQMTYTFDASEDWQSCEGVTNRFIKRAGGNYTNITPFVLMKDSALIGMALTSREAQEWTAIVYCDGEELCTLPSDGQRAAFSDLQFKIPKGSLVSIYASGENILNPGVQLFFSAILPPKTSDRPKPE
jgi:hypothetical protein